MKLLREFVTFAANLVISNAIVRKESAAAVVVVIYVASLDI